MAPAFSVMCLCFALSSGEQSPTPQAAKKGEPSLPGVIELLVVGPGEKDTSRECAATGFFVNAEGYIVTNAHVVENLERCLSKNRESGIVAKPPSSDAHFARAFPAEVVARDPAHDLAVLRIRRSQDAAVDPQMPFVSLERNEVQAGEPVAVSGHPAFSWEPVMQHGRILRGLKLNLAEKNAERTDVWLLDIPLRDGNSGSPVYNLNGRGVVGVVVSRNPYNSDQSVAVQVEYVIELLNDHGIHWEASHR